MSLVMEREHRRPEAGAARPAADHFHQSLSKPSQLILATKLFVTFIIVPLALWFNVHVFVDITVNGRWDFFGETFFQYNVLVLFPTLSHLGCQYVLVSYWMDEETQTVLRTRTMWATVPLFIFFSLQLMGQSTHYNWVDCATEAFVQQACYYQANLWQTMTVYTAYNFIILGRPQLQGLRAIMVHVICWGLPLMWTMLQSVVAPDAFHTDLFESELRGIGWCGVNSTRRIIKAVFVNTPQMISVSIYAQLYYYIHQKIDLEVDSRFESTAKLSTSKHAKLMSLEAARREAYIQETALQLRLQMSAYMLSFLTNTVITLVGDNLTNPAEGPSDAYLITQTGVVTIQGLLVGVVYSRSAGKSLLTAYLDTADDLMSLVSEKAAAKMMRKRAAAKEVKARKLEAARRKRLTKPTAFKKFQNGLEIFYQTALLYPVSVWVWVPMAFIGENTDNKAHIFFGLVIWSAATVFPIYAFSLVGADTSGTSLRVLEHTAQGFALFVMFVSAWAVYINRYSHKLLMIEGPCRYKGSLRKFFGATQGLRFSSCRNCVVFFSIFLEFYQIFGLTWSATRMDALYDGVYDSAASFSGNITDTRTYIVGFPREVFTFWMTVCMVIVWVLLYSFPAVVTTSTVGNRKFANDIQEMYRKYLWFMSGAGFLTVLKACMKILFCVPNLYDPSGPEVTLTDHDIICWSHRHLRMVAISLLCLLVFLPSATLTTLFRYDEEDDRGLPPIIQKTCVLGGEDIRWIHLWRRVEYLIKGIWVFTGMHFAKNGTLACVVLWGGSLIIATFNYFMDPSNIKYMCRLKLNIHLCNSWTTMTCFWAATTLNTNKQTHYIMMWGGWLLIWICVWGYELREARQNPHKKPVGDPFNIDASARMCVQHQNHIMQSTGMSRWSNHAKIVELLRFCEHPDVEIQRHGYIAFEQLAFCDQMTEGYSFFLQLTPTNPTVQIIIRDIENSPDAEIRNLAVRSLNAFLQTNAYNEFGRLVTFHDTLQEHDDERDGQIPVIVARYAQTCEEVEDRIDALQLALEFAQSDSNDIPSIVGVVLPMLNELLETRDIIQQYLGSQFLMFICSRFDCVPQVMDQVGVKSLISLFACVCDAYSKFNGDIETSAVFGYISGEDNAAPSKLICRVRSLPKKFKRIITKLGSTMRRETDHLLGMEDEYTLGEDHIRMMQVDILTFTLATLSDIAFFGNATAREALLDADIWDIVLMRCFTFDATTRSNPDAIDQQATNVLHVEGCRIVQALLSHAFSVQDIRNDDEMSDYYHQLQHFIHDGVDGRVSSNHHDHTDADDDNDEEEMVAEVHAFDGLTPAQRRKAHIVAEFLGLEHESEGAPGNRIVFITRPNKVGNPMRPTDALGTSICAAKESKIDFALYENNFRRVAEHGAATEALKLACQELVDDETMYIVCDILLLLLAHNMLTQDREREDVKRLMLAGVLNPSHGFSVMCSAGANLIIKQSGAYAPFGRRKERYGAGIELFRRSARQVFWMCHWRMNATGRRDVLDFLA